MIEPPSVDAQVLSRFLRHREATSTRNGDLAARRIIAKLWNGCVGRIKGWPNQTLEVPPSKRRGGLAWQDLPEGWRSDVDAYLKLAAMRWEQIEHDGGGLFWHAPKGNRTKRLHSVPLSNLVARIMHPVQQTGFVFPGNRSGHINVDSPAFRKNIIKAGAMDDFFLHGCRHIAETKLSELRIPAHIRDLLLDHASGRGAGKVYDHHEYEDEMRGALEQWADYIARLVQPQGVAVLR